MGFARKAAQVKEMSGAEAIRIFANRLGSALPPGKFYATIIFIPMISFLVIERNPAGFAGVR